MRLTVEQFRSLPTEQQDAYKRLLEQRAQDEERNPVLFFQPNPCPNCGKRENPDCSDHRVGQHEFLKSHSHLTAAFAGNQFGKTTALIVKAFIQHLPLDALPKALKPYKFVSHSDPVVGWIVCPSERAAVNYLIPTLRQWAPRDYLHGHSFDKAWAKQDSILRFKDGGRLHVFTYQQEPDKFVGAQVDYVGFDEPPPQPIYNECSVRVLKRSGRLFFTMTPVNMSGGGIGWIYRDIWKKREDPDVTVIQGSIHDNPHLPEGEVKRFLTMHASDPDLAAREYGEFVHVGGMIYPGGFERVLVDPPKPEHVRDLEVVVGIDPGLKNASFVWVGFDGDNHALVFDEVRLNEKTPVDYAKAIHGVNRKWGIRNPLYVIDPSARNRNLVNRENVQAELQRHGIPCSPGQNQVEPGIQQVRRRIEARSLLISKECRVLRDEAEEYRMQDRMDGEFAVVKEKDHALDALRYALMARPFYAWPAEERTPLGWDIQTNTVSHPSKWLRGVPNVGPLGNWG